MFFPVSGDLYYGNVSLLLPMTGENNGTTFTDVSPSPKTVTRYNAVTSTTQSKWGNSSGYFDGTGDYLSVTGESFSTGDFTVEGWVYAVSPASVFVLLDTRDPDETNNGFVFYVRGTTHITFGRGAPFVATEGTTAVTANNWHHIALTRSSGTVRGFLNGSKDFEVADTKDFSLTSWKIGHQWSASGTISAGYINDLRITKGIARYTADFTVTTGPLPSRLPELPIRRAIQQPHPFHQIARLGL